LVGFSLAIGTLVRGRWRSWVLLVGSILAIYWLQPSIPIRHVDFWLPTITIIFTIVAWILTSPEEIKNYKNNLPTVAVVACVVLLVSLPRYFGDFCCLTPTRPPSLVQLFLLFGIAGVILFLLSRFTSGHAAWINGFSILILVVFILLKAEPLAKITSMGLRVLSGQSPALATGMDIRWLGFSYVAFRLLHTLRDRISGRLPSLSLKDYLIYIIFYPAYPAGPIDRVQRFIQNLHQPYQLTLDHAFIAGKRILIGIFLKFVLADGLAAVALNSINANQVNSTGWLWLMLYAYAFRLFFDFSGYTDIAIGMGNLLGIQLPENFERPYRKQNITLFWNSWHMTLAAWFRSYYFNPVTRALRAEPRIPVWLIIFFGQLSTFFLIGLWHGITWNYAIWGIWHGLGLFVHNRWTEFIRKRPSTGDAQSKYKPVLGAINIFLTFNFVSLGWVWFALSTPEQSWRVFQKLFGFG
jgi:D-alanyl-lipoteichoic acid acyltransferase DltB (MBOAT superfamily)